MDENEEKKRQEKVEDRKRIQEEIEGIEAEIFRLYPECKFKKGKTYPIYALMRDYERLNILKSCLIDAEERKHWFTADPHPLKY